MTTPRQDRRQARRTHTEHVPEQELALNESYPEPTVPGYRITAEPAAEPSPEGKTRNHVGIVLGLTAAAVAAAGTAVAVIL